MDSHKLKSLNSEVDLLFADYERSAADRFQNFPFPKSRKEKEEEKDKCLSSMREVMQHAQANDAKFRQIFRSSSDKDVTKPETALPLLVQNRPKEGNQEDTSSLYWDDEEDPENPGDPVVPEPCAYCRGGHFCALRCANPKKSKLPPSSEVFIPHPKGNDSAQNDFFISFKEFKQGRIDEEAS